MAKQRYINTRFWTDDYVSNLDPIEKLLFLYLITNQNTEISGVYEIPMKTVATDTGIDRDMVTKILKRFEKDKKIKYQDGWVVIRNFVKHQNTESPKIKKGIELSMNNCPSWCIPYTYPIDTLSHSNTNSNTNSNVNNKTSEDVSATPKQVKKEKVPFGEFEKVKLTEEEYSKLIEKMGEKNTHLLIGELDAYIASKGKRYSSHYATILTWARRKIVEIKEKKIKNNVAFH